MADEHHGSDGPSLELPSLGFGRRKRKEPRDAEGSGEPPIEVPVARMPPPAVSEPAPDPVPASAETRPLFTDEVAPAPLAPPAPTSTPEPVASSAPGPAAEPERKAPARARRARRTPSLPAIGGMLAAMVTGAVIGMAVVGLTWGSQRTCEAARGTSSCGAAGFWLLVAIMVAMVFLGSVLLRAWRVPDPGSTSFLAVGLLAVLALLFLVDVIFSGWMVVVVPVLTVASFALAHRVTTAFDEPGRD
ncbi:hypothetical protein ACT8ZV_02270 [Nocardioides sp. MAHUQ-72]|uniref:hypothetical protein n=1 Tax=unclassified Nocardioides TaxID=2615069 RepID=UPI00361BAAC1